jgi:hypothetical protein
MPESTTTPKTITMAWMGAALLLVALLGLSACGSSTPEGGEVPEGILRVVNESEQDICNVFLSPSDQTQWGGDQLSSGTRIAAGEMGDLDVGAGAYTARLESCEQDLLLEVDDIDTSGGSVLRLTSDNAMSGGRRADATLSLSNNAGAPVCYIYVVPPDGEHWRRNRLAVDEIVNPGETRIMDIPAGEYDVRVESCRRDVLLEDYSVNIAEQLTLAIGP